MKKIKVDIVERLRQAGSDGCDMSSGDPLCLEAAKEIEFLRKIINAAVINKIKDKNP